MPEEKSRVPVDVAEAIRVDCKQTEIMRTMEFEFEGLNLILDVMGNDVEGVTINVEGYQKTELERAKKATKEPEKRPNPCLYLKGATIAEVEALGVIIAGAVTQTHAVALTDDYVSLASAAKAAKEKKAEEKKPDPKPTPTPASKPTPVTPPTNSSKPGVTASVTK